MCFKSNDLGESLVDQVAIILHIVSVSDGILQSQLWAARQVRSLLHTLHIA